MNSDLVISGLGEPGFGEPETAGWRQPDSGPLEISPNSRSKRRKITQWRSVVQPIREISFRAARKMRKANSAMHAACSTPEIRPLPEISGWTFVRMVRLGGFEPPTSRATI